VSVIQVKPASGILTLRITEVVAAGVEALRLIGWNLSGASKV
jgi:hypothetical protein